MERRQFIKAGILASLSIGLVGTGAHWLTTPSNHAPLTIDAVMRQLSELSKSDILSSGQWSPYEIFIHCAQSVEFSMTGFPQHKPDLFKHTAGQLAFSVFSSKGQMMHALDEPIPGAPLIEAKDNLQAALTRFAKSLTDFQQFTGKLAPHFAYGELSKRDYEIAHTLHFYNHLQELRVNT